MGKVRHKVFVSYHHEKDQSYKDRFEELFEDIFINKSVAPGGINTDVSDDYIKRLIQENYITDSSVLVVLVGPKTYLRKHVDWEISAALSKKVGGYSGLIGLLLPTHPDYGIDKLPQKIPPRLLDNIKSGYAKLYQWTEDSKKLKKWIGEAFITKNKNHTLINNSRKQFEYNKLSEKYWFLALLATVGGFIYGFKKFIK